MSYEDFDWQKMVNKGTLEKQRVCVLYEYIENLHLSAVRNKKKPENVSAIIHHLLHAVSTSERDEDQDLVIDEIGESSDDKSESDSVSVFVSGRKNCYHPIEQKYFFCLVSPTQRALVCSSQVLIQICFIKRTESFSFYHVI